jgi:hypothetical protein
MSREMIEMSDLQKTLRERTISRNLAGTVVLIQITEPNDSRSEHMKTRQTIFAIFSITTLCVAALPVRAAEPGSTLEEKIEAANAGVTPYVAGVVRLAKSGIDATVLQSYVENASNVSPLKADEVLYLHNHAVPAPVIAAMIKRAALVTEQVTVVAPAPTVVINNTSPAPITAPAPAPVSTTVYVAPAPVTYTYVPATPVYYQSSPNVIFPYPPSMTYRSLGFHYGGRYDYCYTSYPSYSRYSSHGHRRW